MNKISLYNRPILFYFLATSITWIAWFKAAYLSHMEPVTQVHETLSGILILVGLVSPTVVAFVMMLKNPKLKNDLFDRLFKFSKVKPIYIALALGMMPASILLAQLISLLFGHSIDQFTFAKKASFTFSLFPAWFMLFLAPAIEELAWHSYGTDCLRAKFNLFITSIIFAAFWVLWHYPLSYVKGYYHSNIAEAGIVYVLNFSLSLFPFVLLMNWLYYKSNRNILIAVIFHVTAGFFNELFNTHPDSKLIQTGLLLILVLYIVSSERKMFFQKKVLGKI